MNKLIFIALVAFCAIVAVESRLFDGLREDVQVDETININIDDDSRRHRHYDDDDDDDDRRKRAIILDPMLQQQIMLNPTMLDQILIRGKRAIVMDPMLQQQLLVNPMLQNPLAPSPLLRAKRAVLETDTITRDIFGNVREVDVISTSPVSRGKRAIFESDTVEVDDFGNRVEQKVFEETDPILRGKRALLVADSYLEALLLNKPVMTETFVMQPMQATMLRGKRDTFEQDTISTDAFGNRVEVDNLVRNKRATIIQDVFLTRDLFGNLVEQPVLLIV